MADQHPYPGYPSQPPQSQPPPGYQQQPPAQGQPPPGFQQQPPPQGYGQPSPGYHQQPPQPVDPQQVPFTQQPAGEWHPSQPTDNGPSYQWDDAPGDDVDEDENATEPIVARPTNIGGGYSEGDYANINFDDSAPVPPPPTYDEAMQNSERPAEEFSGTASMSEEEVRDAMLQYVSEHCCYGSKPAKEMTFKKILPSSALHYQLETFCESRTTKREFEPYRGTQVDNHVFGQPPPVWAMECHPDRMFYDHTKSLRVPHTEYVTGCHNCNSRGFVRCWRCHGRGRIRCGRCHGSGRITYHTQHGTSSRNCPSCFMGRKRCHTCGGDGRITCRSCQGLRQLLHFIQLNVHFQTHINDYILEKTDLPDELIRDVNGDDIFAQEDFAVWPITSYPMAEICSNSQNLISSHRQMYQSEKQLRQKHWLRSVPVSEVQYKYKDVDTRFWVYGFEKKVHAPDYPAQCCWGCNIL